MGCDIHFYVEVQEKGSWVHHDPRGPEPEDWVAWKAWDNKRPSYIYDGRDYRLFSRLANVRSGWAENGPEPKGFPKDASQSVKDQYEDWGVDAHSASHYTVAQLNAHFKGSDFGVFTQNTLPALNALAGQYGADRVRAVFWFDN